MQTLQVDGSAAESVGCVKRWLSRLAPGSWGTYLSYLNRFLAKEHMMADEAIAWGRREPDKLVVLDLIQNFVLMELKGRRFKTKNTCYTALRSFFVHNRVLLPEDPSFRIRGDAPSTERKITIPDLRRLIGLATQPMRSMIMVKWASLLDTEGLIYFSNHYAEQVTAMLKGKELEPLKVEIPGRKSSRNLWSFYTFIGREALESLREYFEKERGWPKGGEPIWIFSNSKGKGARKITFNQAWLSLLRRAKLIPKKRGSITSRYGYGAHNTRDLAISLMNTVPGFNPQSAEFMAGHAKKVDPLGYNDPKLKPEYVRKQYELAEPYLNILSQKTVESNAQELKSLSKENEELKTLVKQQDDRMSRLEGLWESVLEKKIKNEN